MIIVFAVSFSIWLHNWSESRKDRDEERDFLLGLKQDLQADMQEMKGDSALIRFARTDYCLFLRLIYR